MKPILPGGLLAVVEGIDGAGKSTVIPALAGYLRESGFECVASREPTDGEWGRTLRESAQSGRLSLAEEIELFARDRRQHVEQLIRPALDAGKAIVLDRYYFSTAAYQGARGADPLAILEQNERFAPRADIVLLLDYDPAQALNRVRSRGDAPNEFEQLEALERIREIFLSIRRPEIVRIDAAQDRETVARDCIRAVSEAIARKSAGSA